MAPSSVSRPLQIVAWLVCLLLTRLADAAPTGLPDGLYAEIETPRGVLIARLFPTHAPLTVTHFVGLAEGTLGPRRGRPFFDGLTFHRVVPGFVIQGGDPRGDGEGGPGYTFPDEFTPALRHDRAGVLSMANSGPDTNGSQFFITLAPHERLDYLHSVFGEVVDGLAVLPLVEQGDTMHVRIHRVGTAARAFRADQASFDRLVAAAPKAHPPTLDDPDQQLPQQPDWARILGHKLDNLQRFGGAPLHIVLHRTLPPERNGPALAADLARRAGITTGGLAAIYIADSHLWFLAAGTETRSRLTRDGETPAAARHRLLAAIDAVADAAIAERYGENPVPPEQFCKRHLDALIDTLIPYLEPRPPGRWGRTTRSSPRLPFRGAKLKVPDPCAHFAPSLFPPCSVSPCSRSPS